MNFVSNAQFFFRSTHLDSWVQQIQIRFFNKISSVKIWFYWWRSFGCTPKAILMSELKWKWKRKWNFDSDRSVAFLWRCRDHQRPKLIFFFRFGFTVFFDDKFESNSTKAKKTKKTKNDVYVFFLLLFHFWICSKNTGKYIIRFKKDLILYFLLFV